MRNSRGFALLEVVAALVILSVAGVALLELTAMRLRAQTRAIEREHQEADAERLLTAYALLTRADLDQRLGTRTVGSYTVRVERVEPALYRIALADLVTVVYRQGESSAR